MKSNRIDEASVQAGHKKWITGISWEPVHLQSPCRRFVTSSKDGDARIWDATMRKTVIVLSGHILAVTCVKWGGDGFIYTGATRSGLQVYLRNQYISNLYVITLSLLAKMVMNMGCYNEENCYRS
nr:notchless protein homolog [Tanacetum cinerariifolium]